MAVSLEVLFVGVHFIRDLLFWFHVRASDIFENPHILYTLLQSQIRYVWSRKAI